MTKFDKKISPQRDFQRFFFYPTVKDPSTAPDALLAVSPAIETLGQGAMFTAIVLGAILVFIIDDDYIKAAVAALVGAGMTAVGFIHAPKLAFMYNPDYVLAYVVVAITLIGFHFMKDPEVV
jgi:AGZA family xanthine/uracil permease-like MFS transporter